MPLDPHARRLLEMIAAGRRDDPTNLSADALRQSMKQLARATDVRDVPIGAIEDRNLPGEVGLTPIRLYTPCGEDVELPPCVIYFHGGTGIFCDLDTHDGLCRMLAQASGCRVISVGYRLAPEHPFPAGLMDAVTATQWIAANAAELRIDGDRLIVAGDSAGGTLAAVVCQLARTRGPRIVLQVLLCPVTDLAAETESRLSFAQGYFIERATLEWAKTVYCGDAAPSDCRISPLRARSFAGLPPALIHTAELDPMRDEGEAYARALERAGVTVHYTCHAGLIHHFYCMAGAIPRARAAVAAVGEEIRAAIHQSSMLARADR
jgi:acetyl esterase/lipase